jgi:RNA polymerase sigma-70 factor (ECF subfamily)
VGNFVIDGNFAIDGTKRPARAFGCVTITRVDVVPSEPDELAPLPMSFDEFFASRHSEMVRALTLALGDVEFGRDAAAEGFARALERWSIVSGYANPSGWVYRVGLNWARSGRRKLRRERTGMRLTELEAPEVTLHDESLVSALGRLSVEHRTVVIGRYYFDWSEAQLAEALDLSPGTVKSRLNRAVSKLASLMEGPNV